jgi:hypothetical protein
MHPPTGSPTSPTSVPSSRRTRRRHRVEQVLRMAMAMAGLCGAATAAATDIDPALLGCWRAERVDQTLADGTRWTDVGGCTLEFLPDRIVSACALRAGNRPIVYAWQVTEPGTYRARITDHPVQPQAVGSERDYQYRLEGDRLLITTFPQSAQPAPVSRAVRVESVSVKVGSATDLAGPDDTDKAGCQGPLATRQPPHWLAQRGAGQP